MELPLVIQMIAQLGAVGLLAMIVWAIPKILKEHQKAREAEQKRWSEEREADRQARKVASDTYKHTVDTFMDKMSIEGQKNREMFSSETKYERESCERKFDALITQASAHHDSLTSKLGELLVSTNEQNKLLRSHHIVLQGDKPKTEREY